MRRRAFEAAVKRLGFPMAAGIPCGTGCVLRAMAAIAAMAAAPLAVAHDTWFERRAAEVSQRPVMALGTGNLFPVFDSRNELHTVVFSACQAGATVQGPLVVAQPQAADLVVFPPRDLPSAPRVSCWAQLQPFELELADELVEVYFKEAMPPAAVRQAWAAQKVRGQPWRERYVKHARIEWFADAQAGAQATAPSPPSSGMGMDALMLQPLQAPRVGDDLEFLVLKDGRPLHHFAVEFRLHTSRSGLWRRTDEHGRVRLKAPSAGRWLMRGIDITPPAPGLADPVWQGLFITLAFDVLAPVRR